MLLIFRRTQIGKECLYKKFLRKLPFLEFFLTSKDITKFHTSCLIDIDAKPGPHQSNKVTYPYAY